MLLQKSGSYYEDFRRMKGVPASEPSDPKRLLTDRSAYISYLEVQLERVSTACMTSQGYRCVKRSAYGGGQGMRWRVCVWARSDRLNQQQSQIDSLQSQVGKGGAHVMFL